MATVNGTKRNRKPSERDHAVVKSPFAPLPSVPRPVGRALSKVERRMLAYHSMLRGSQRNENIPMLREVFNKGSQTPVLRLKLAPVSCDSDGSGVMAVSATVCLANVINTASWDDVFDEFRILFAHAVFAPKYFTEYANLATGTLNRGGDIVGYHDYDDSGTPTAYTIWGYDNARVGNTHRPLVLPPCQPDFVPDTQWYNTQTDQSTVVGTWKIYANGLSQSTSYGKIYIWADFQFRTTV